MERVISACFRAGSASCWMCTCRGTNTTATSIAALVRVAPSISRQQNDLIDVASVCGDFWLCAAPLVVSLALLWQLDLYLFSDSSTSTHMHSTDVAWSVCCAQSSWVLRISPCASEMEFGCELHHPMLLGRAQPISCISQPGIGATLEAKSNILEAQIDEGASSGLSKFMQAL